MARTLLTNNRWVTSLADPAGVAAASAGNNYSNDGLVMLRVVNAKANANAIATLTMSGTVSSGSYDLYVKDALGVVYKAAGISYAAINTAIQSAVYAAAQPNGNTLATDYPSAVVTIGGGPLAVGTVATITFSGASGLGAGGLASTPVEVTADGTSLVGSGATLAATMTTKGTGIQVLTAEIPLTYQGIQIPFKRYLIPGNSAVSWVGPLAPGTYNQADGSVWLDFDDYTQFTLTAFHVG